MKEAAPKRSPRSVIDPQLQEAAKRIRAEVKETLEKNRTVEVAANMMTGRAGIFAGGDMVPAVRSVTVAT